MESLAGEKKKRMSRQHELYESLEKLCRRAATNDTDLFDDIHEKIYSEDELTNVRRALSSLYDTVVKRQEIVSELQSESKK